MIREKFLKFFSIRRNEQQFVAVAGMYALLDGIIHEYIQVIPLALFLGRLDIVNLPYVYIITAFVFLFITFIYNYISKRVSVIKLTNSSVVFIAASIVVFWAFLNGVQHNYSALFLLVWGWVIYSLISLILSVLFGSILTLQQAKRLYGPIDTAHSIGGILGACSIPFLVTQIGTLNSLLVIPILLLFQLAIQFRFKHLYEKKLVIINKTDFSSVNRSVKDNKFIKNKYILFVLIVGVFISVEYYILDMLFNTELQSRFLDEEKIAQFLGVFYAIVNVASLLTSAFALKHLFEKYGSIVSLLIMPVLTTLIIAIAYIFNIISSSIAIVFWAIALTRMLESIMNISVNEQAIGLLFQVLRQRERIWARTQHSTFSFSLALGTSGVVLLLLIHFFGVNIEVFGIVLILLCLAHIFFLYLIRSRYVGELINSLSKHFLIRPQFQEFDKESLEILRRSLKSKFPDEVVYVLSTLEKENFGEFRQELINALDHPAKAVQDLVLTKLEHYRVPEALDKLVTFCKKHPRENSIIALAACGGRSVTSQFEEWLQKKEMSIKSGAIIGILKYGPSSLHQAAEDAWFELGKSTNPKQREKAAYIHGKMRKLPTVLLQFLQDENLAVRKAACEATAHMRESFFLPHLIENLSVPSLQSSASVGLRAQNPTGLVDFLHSTFDQYSMKVKEVLIKVLAEMQGTDDFLLHLLHQSNRKIFHFSLQALQQRQAHLELNESKFYLSKESNYLTELQNALDAIGTSKKNALLQSLIFREWELSLSRIFMLLSFLYSREAIQAVINGFAIRNEESLSYATELLFNILSKDDKQHLLPLLNQAQNRLLGEGESGKKADALEGIRYVLAPERDFYISGIVSAALYIGAQHYRVLQSTIQAVAETENLDPVFQDTVRYIIPKID